MILENWAGRVRSWGAAWVGVAALTGLWAAQVTPNSRDTLAFKDGDRVQGVVIESTAEFIVFRTDRFGELRVPAKDAVVIRAEVKPAPASPAATPPTVATKAERQQAAAKAQSEEEEQLSVWDRFSLSVLTARVGDYFGPWHGRVAFSVEVVSDSTDRSNTSYETQLRRKWEKDEVQLGLRYDYNETDDAVTTDMLKGGGQWRHDFSSRFFGNYRPTVEWNQANQTKGATNDYVLLQQEIGAGYNVLTSPRRKVRVGVSQNFFDTWSSAPASEHTSRGVMSAFGEAEFVLPWRITISERGVWYPVGSDTDGWENRIDLNKKLTETLSTSLRHEIRRNNPDGSAQDYTRLKVLFGLDF